MPGGWLNEAESLKRVERKLPNKRGILSDILLSAFSFLLFGSGTTAYINSLITN